MADRQKQVDKELTQPLLSSDEDPYGKITSLFVVLTLCVFSHLIFFLQQATI